MLTKEEFYCKYVNKTLYFFLLKNTHTNNYSIGFLTNNKPSRYDQTKYSVVRLLKGIKFSKYESFCKRYWDYYDEYCRTKNEDSKPTYSVDISKIKKINTTTSNDDSKIEFMPLSDFIEYDFKK